MNKDKYTNFSQTKFGNLMQRRIQSVLLISSSYDAFLLEEDGRIEEQIFNEYVSLNIRYPPRFIKVTNSKDALKVLENQTIDLVISMLSVGGMDTFSLAKTIKAKNYNIPFVVLTPFSREVSQKLSNEDTSAIDYVFCWLGNADILVAIIKLLEDKMNAENDILGVGVQCIILVEDSIRYYSSYLPIIYRIVFKQSKKFMTEALNEHQKMMRMRGRPKILLARNYEEAMDFYSKYRENALGVISDVSFSRKGIKDNDAGINLAKRVKRDDPYFPFLLQSSDLNVIKQAKQIKVGFLYKYSKTLLQELKHFLRVNLAFGDFVFINPETHKEVKRVSTLKQLQEKLSEIPEDSLYYHFKRNHVSKWLKARALFTLSEKLKIRHIDDFKNVEEAKEFIYDSIVSYRINKAKGVIATFNPSSYDKYVKFARIGEGSIGGKARGLAFLTNIIERNSKLFNFENVDVTIPRTVVIGTDIFEMFMENNNLYEIALSDVSDEEILERFVKAKLPHLLHVYLRKFIAVINNPIAVRSSSVLEDSHYQPFAGIYSTYMISNVDSSEVVMKQISDAIKCVYASVYFKSSKAYMQATMNIIDEERMGIVLQEVVGNRHGNYFYPTISGVARSVNFYPIAPETSKDGIANVALGLGRQIVEGGVSLRFSPVYPQKSLQLSTPEITLRETQKTFFAIDLDNNSFVPSVNDGVNLKKLDIRVAQEDGELRWIGSIYDYHNRVIREGSHHKGAPLVTFSKLLKYDAFPLAEIVNKVLAMGCKEMNQPVEVEFAVDLQMPQKRSVFYLLQIRPIVESEENTGVNLKDINKDETLIYSSSALGNGVNNDIREVVFVKSKNFKQKDLSHLVPTIEKINQEILDRGKNYILVGPGRWGSQDPWLGIPVRWAQISGAAVIVETAIKGFSPDPSQGTHFFQNVTSLRVGYLTVNTNNDIDKFDENFLLEKSTIYEDEYIKHVCLDDAVTVKLDGKNGLGAVFYPDEEI